MSRRRAFTLIELLVSLTVSSMIVVALGSAIVLSVRAVPAADDPGMLLMDTSSAVDSMLDELGMATRVVDARSSGCVFTLPDRDDDGYDETIEYEVSSDRLRRRANGGPWRDVTEELHRLEFEWTTEDVEASYPGPQTQSAEQVLAQFSPLDPDVGWTALDSWHARVTQYIQPALAPGSMAYEVTGASIFCHAQGKSSGEITGRLTLPDATGMPNGEEFDSVLVLEDDLSGGSEWNEFALTTPARPSGAPLVLDLQFGGDGVAMTYHYDPALDGGRSYEAGGTWHTNEGTLLYALRGIVTSRIAEQTVTTQLGRRVRITAEPTTNANLNFDTSRRLVNRPSMPETFYAADFNADPTQHDGNGDGTPDWTTNTDSFDTGRLVDGSWQADTVTELETAPPSTFDDVVVVDVRLRDTVDGGLGAVVIFEPHRVGSTLARIRLAVQKDPAGQRVRLAHFSSASTSEDVLDRVVMGDAFVDARLIVEPTMHTFALWLNGEPAGTFEFDEFGSASIAARGLRLLGSDTGAEFEAIDIRVGGTADLGTNNHPTAVVAETSKAKDQGDGVSFDGTGSSDPDGDKLSYLWTFGDGAKAEGSTAVHIYGAPGIYTATLTVTDGRGGIDVDSIMVYISPVVGG